MLWSDRRIRLITTKEHSGAMVALMLDDSDSAALLSALPLGMTPESNLHITLAYLGEAAYLTRQQSDDIDDAMRFTASMFVPITGTVSGIGYFNQDESGQRVLYASFDAPNLPELRQTLVEALDEDGIHTDDSHGFTPHITLAYCSNDNVIKTEVPELPTLKITFSSLTRRFGDDQMDFSLEPAGFMVKEVNGVHRWVLISSSAFEDRDREVVSAKALQMDVDRADIDGDYGTLRWWHIPGAELGDCDFNMLHGRMLYESGTFRSKQIAEAVKANAHLLGASIGFTHPVTEPDSDGVFHNIKRFERSLLPREFASNPFTAVSLVEKESHMTLIEDKLKAFGKILGGDATTVAAVLALGATKEAEADATGTRHKEKQECPIGFHWDDDKQDCVKDAPKEDAPTPPAEDKKEYMGDMTPEAFKHILTEVVDARMTTLKSELQSQLDTATTVKAESEKAYVESLKAMDTKLDGIAKSAKSALDGVAELKGELPRALGERLKGYHPSTDGDTPPDTFKDMAPKSDTVVDKFMASLGVAPTN